ncbi:MAG: HAD family hydrolase [Phycisphaerales bacterium JB059]
MLDCDLLIFDCDGVLVDTEPTTNRLLARCVSEAGWDVSYEDSIRIFKGRDLHEILEQVESKLGRSLPGFIEEYRARMFEAFETDPPPPVPGAVELLDLLDAGSGAPRRCVASNGPVQKMLASLTGAGLLDRFACDQAPGHLDGHAIFSAYDVGVWKPEPDLFLHAANAMGHPPEACVVVEDSVSGVIAARRAGMRVCALAGLTPAADLREAGATRVVDALHELHPRTV